MNDLSTIAQLDRASTLHPFTQLKDFATGNSATRHGRNRQRLRIRARPARAIDAFAGLYCVNIGYGRAEVADAIARQAYRLAYYHSYAAHTTDELAILPIGWCAWPRVK